MDDIATPGYLPNKVKSRGITGVEDIADMAAEENLSAIESATHSLYPLELMPSEDDALFGPESLFARLQEAQESAFEELEDRIAVASVVGAAILKGFVTALCEESSESLAAKDREIALLKNSLEEKDAKIIQLEIALQLKEDEWTKSVEESVLQRYKLIADFMQAMDKTEQVSISREVYVVKKEKELSEIAEHLVRSASALEAETQRATMLEQRLEQMCDLDSIKTREIEALSEEIDRLTLLHKNSFDMLLKRTELGYMNQVEFLVTENHRLLDALDVKNFEQENEISKNQSEVCDETWHRDELLVDRNWTEEEWPPKKKPYDFRWNKIIQDLQMDASEQNDVHNSVHGAERRLSHDFMEYSNMEDECNLTLESQSDHIATQEWAISMEVDIMMTLMEKYFDEFSSRNECKDVRILNLELNIEEVKWMQTLEASVILAFMENSAKDHGNGNDVCGVTSIGSNERSISLKEELLQKELTIEELERAVKEVNLRSEMEIDVCLSFVDGYSMEMQQTITEYKKLLDLRDDSLHTLHADLNSQRLILARQSSALSAARSTHGQLESDLDNTKGDLQQEKMKVQHLQHNLWHLETSKKEADDELLRMVASLDSLRQDHLEQQWQQHLETHIMVETLEGMYIDSIRMASPLYVAYNGKSRLGSEKFQDAHTLEVAANWEAPSVRSSLVSAHSGINVVVQGSMDNENSIAKGVFYLEEGMETCINQLNYSANEVDNILVVIPRNEVEKLELHFSEALKQKDSALSRTLMEKDGEKLQLEIQLEKVKNSVREHKSTVSSVHKQITLEFTKQVNFELENSQKSIQYFASRIHEQIIRLGKAQVKVERVHKYRKIQESNHKCKLGKYINNLQKAEEEVDLLGDEVDTLLKILEKVFITLEHYGPVFQHYPGMTELAKLVRQEVFLRVDPSESLQSPGATRKLCIAH